MALKAKTTMMSRTIATLNPETLEIEWMDVEVPGCPRCDTPMVHLINRHAGTLFFGCPQYPRCRANMSMESNRDYGVKRLDLKAIAKQTGDKVLQKYSEMTAREEVHKRQLKTLEMGMTNTLAERDLYFKAVQDLELEVDYLRKCLESPTIEEHEKEEIEGFFAEIDQRADADIERILERHRDRQKRRKALDLKMKKAFHRAKAPKATKSYWKQQVAKTPSKLKKLTARVPSRVKSVVKFIFCLAILVALVLGYFQVMGLVLDQCF